ncbi:hypothetical protein RHS01_02267 [Rhizoctonia solani]|uniref:Uncharacterized protein n=1 Tax=Rhizoctonia solani TaxID=456999 RepID=A0A8H7IFY2_9AGAM|nr:hypothetical protein RHS01_02267 [Rhizoctonia solani]
MVWSTISKVFSFGSRWGENSVRIVEGNDAAAMLKRVEGILEDSMRVLSSHERILAQGEFNMFSVKHRNLVLKVVEVKHEIRDEQTRGVLSASPAGRQPFTSTRRSPSFTDRHRFTTTASRRAQAIEEEAFDKQYGVASDDRLDSQTFSAPEPTTTWYSVIVPSSRDSLTSSETDSDTATLVESHPYLAIAHVRPELQQSTDSEDLVDKNTYREILLLESSEKTVIMINPNRRHVSKELDSSDETSLIEMSRAGEACSEPQILIRYEIIGAQQETSWVDSFVNTLSRLGVGIGADMM